MQILFPEDITEESVMIRTVVRQFVEREIWPKGHKMIFRVEYLKWQQK